jgi:hypothetical protein
MYNRQRPHLFYGGWPELEILFDLLLPQFSLHRRAVLTTNSNGTQCSATPKKMMRLVEISRQETNAVIQDLFPLVHRGY